ncbi:hypothetical protein IWQ61_002892 [Dispira simplex]|nr:hypothetical protein IWQ61_002892 [Dispira simplex]
MTEKSAIIFIANGSEDIETVTTLDILRRAKVKVQVVGVELGRDYALLAHGLKVIPDQQLESTNDLANYDAVIIPGGLGGVQVLSKNAHVLEVLQKYYAQGKLVAAICAGPLAVKAAGVAKHPTPSGVKTRLTSYPSVMDQLVDSYAYGDSRVVTDGNLITSRGPGTAVEFALTVAKYIVGSDTAHSVANAILSHTQP